MHVPAEAVSALAVTSIFTFLALFTVITRIFTRAIFVKVVGAEDYIMIAAMAASIVFMAVRDIIEVKTGLGQQITFDQLQAFLEAVWGIAPAYFLSLGLCKVSIVVQCLRIFRTSTTRRVLYAFLLFTIVYTIWAVLSAIFNCIPPQAAWGAAPKGKCLDAEAVGFANAAINIFSDICVLVIPIPQLKTLQIPRKQRIILITVFSCGGFACITSIIRLYSFWVVSTSPEEIKSTKAVDIAIWSGIEINLGIICASVPTLKPLASRLLPKLLSYDLYNTSGRAYGGDRSTRIKVTGDYGRHTRLEESQKTAIDTTIMVEQSIELRTVAAPCTEDSDKLSQDGSQNELVDGTGWHSAKLAGGGTSGTRWDIGSRKE
ncbi:hypothetical protein N7495_003988 [Penicillium taxi]|uniref:uncharacterized protein n=1 Tax=Penicillium taxi TaxID=168475 RepID=UPI002544DFEF|nr:uncharacterized protein N7495_003988 [Penicillium taxi]KAJ5899244.1 hypothetical protein N7495_003988 [Penicillium taxi]